MEKLTSVEQSLKKWEDFITFNDEDSLDSVLYKLDELKENVELGRRETKWQKRRRIKKEAKELKAKDEQLWQS